MSFKILDVGQCGFDGPRIEGLLRSKLSAEVGRAGTAAEARKQLAAGRYDVVLVNRVLNGDGSSGVDLIAELAAGTDAPPLMLVSDREDAQEAAVAAGGVRGFGKAALDDPATYELIRSAARPADQ
jgi:DNA-binding NarL/FixJ family response regulator